MNEHERKFPTDPDKILSLPGIGKYTLGAIASIAFQKPLPLVDGNVIRVYSRFFALPGNPQDLKFQKKIWDLADEFLDRKNPGDFNQALMELGATICTPMSPSCLLCPIQKECRGKLNPEKFPQKKEKQKTKKLSRLVALLIEKNKICLVLPENNRWQKGLWQLPGILTEKKEDLEKEMKEFLEKEKIPSDSLTLLPSHKHHITHHKITIYPYLTKLNVIPKIREKSRWVSHSELKDIAIPAADRKIIESLKLSS